MSDPSELIARLLKRQLFVAWSTPRVPAAELRPSLAAHLEYWIAQEKAGVLFAAGPFTHGPRAVEGEGMMIVRARDREHAKEIFDRDPFHETGLRSYELYDWLLNEGRIGIQLDFSDQSCELL